MVGRVVEEHVFLAAVQIAVSVAVDVPGRVSLGTDRAMREVKVVAHIDQFQAIHHHVPAVVGVPLNALLIVVAAHEHLGNAWTNTFHYVLMHFLVGTDADVAQVDEHISWLRDSKPFVDLIHPIAATPTPFGELLVIEVCIAYEPVVHWSGVS